jgi:FkbM family methyltransferase
MNDKIPPWLSEKEFNRSAPTEVFFNLPEHKKVLHIGGHLGREAKYYNDVTFVEPMPKYAEYLRQQGHNVVEGAICGEELYVTSYDQASSVLKPKEHKVIDKITVKNYSLDDVNDGTFDMLVMDIQGGELSALKSGTLNFKFIIVETSKKPRYEGAGSKEEIEEYLQLKGYKKLREFQHRKNDIYDVIFEKETL